MKKIIFFALFSILSEYAVAQNECTSCPYKVAVDEDKIYLLFEAAWLPLLPVRVVDANGNECGPYEPFYVSDSGGKMWIVPAPNNNCSEASPLALFTGEFLIGESSTSTCVFKDGVLIDCENAGGGGTDPNDDGEWSCEDCPTSFEALPNINNTILMNFDNQMPPGTAPIQYINWSGTVFGPFNPSVVGPDQWKTLFPTNYCCPLTSGSILIGNHLECKYQEGTLAECFVEAAGCEDCPEVILYDQVVYGGDGSIPYNALLAFETTPPVSYPEPVSIEFHCGEAVYGPYNANWFGTHYWGILIEDNGLCCDPLSCTIVINGEQECEYQNGILIDCGNAHFSEDCSHLEDCADELSEFIVNLPYSGCAKWQTKCNTTDPLRRFGPVRIGNVPIPNGYKLAVDGGVMTDFVKVQLCEASGWNWCDYVFSEDYPLADLYEVESFIDKNGYLPGTPSEKDIVDEGGIEAKSTMLNQQVKIEEIFLYLIQLNNQLKRVNEEIHALEAENNVLRMNIK